jgi:hypothetical protein
MGDRLTPTTVFDGRRWPASSGWGSTTSYWLCSDLGDRRATLIYANEYSRFSISLMIEALEILPSQKVEISKRLSDSFDGLDPSSSSTRPGVCLGVTACGCE